MRGQGLGTTLLLEHEELRQDGDSFEIDGEGPHHLERR